ncbi:MAG: hypothetical protein WC356_03265 [Candidatus Micrarchaeia archaeon]|jgi:hypothetical protein
MATYVEQYVSNEINKQDTLSTKLSELNISKNGELDLSLFFMYYKVEPIIYNSKLSEQEVVNYLQNIDLNKVKQINGKYSQYLGQDLNKLKFTKEEKEEFLLCLAYQEIYGISNNDEYIIYLDPDYLYNKKLQLVSKSKKDTIKNVKHNMENVKYTEYNLSSYYHEMDEILNKVKNMDILDFSDKVYTFEDKQVIIPSPLQYINAATLVGISCQETCPRGTKTIVLPKNPDELIIKGKNRKTEKRIPTDLVRAKMFELMLSAGYNPFTCFAINDTKVSFGHTQAIEDTYAGLIYPNGKSVDFTKLNKNSISKFFDFFDRNNFLKLSNKEKEYLQLPNKFEKCINSKDQILFSYYLALYNFTRFMKTYMSQDLMTERTFLFLNSFSKASEAERFRFVSAMTASLHHLGEGQAKEFFQRTLVFFLKKREENIDFDTKLKNVNLDDITKEFINQLRRGADEHAKTSMNIGEIVSRWQIEEEFVAYTSSSDTLLNLGIGEKIGNFFSNLFKQNKDSKIALELEKPPVEITGEEKEGITFECTLGSKRTLIIQSNRTKHKINNYDQNETVEYYTFSYPQWANPNYSLVPVLKEKDETTLVNDILLFNNIDDLKSTGDKNSKEPMKSAQVFWIPIDYIKFNGPELGEIIVPNNNKEKTEKILEEFCIGGASDENLRMIQLTSNIFNMNEPNDRLLIPYSILKSKIRNQIEDNSK